MNKRKSMSRYAVLAFGNCDYVRIGPVLWLYDKTAGGK